jgi:hypothetical protein
MHTLFLGWTAADERTAPARRRQQIINMKHKLVVPAGKIDWAWLDREISSTAPSTLEVECIGNGKASAPYEFGVKVSIVITNARGRTIRAARQGAARQSL